VLTIASLVCQRKRPRRSGLWPSFTEEQIINVLKEHAVGDACREYGISDGTFYKWRPRYGGVEISDGPTLQVLPDIGGDRDISFHSRWTRS
jgi:hypothetical protein